jgi:prolyl oligopeptidase
MSLQVRAGHGAGKPTAKIIEEAADMYGFAAKCMNAKWVDTKASQANGTKKEEKEGEVAKDAALAGSAANKSAL